MIGAKESPRVEEDGSLHWYYGDSVDIDFELALIGYDEEGTPFIIPFNDASARYNITIVIKNKRKDVVLTKTYEYADVTIVDDNYAKITFSLTSEESSRLDAGDYTFKMSINKTDISKTVLDGDENFLIID